MSAPEILPPPPAPATGSTPASRPRDERRLRVAEIIRRLHGQAGGLSRVHRTHPALYARARRAFGSWREAVAAAGLDYVRERRDSLKRGLSQRDRRRAAWRAVANFLAVRPEALGADLERERPELARRVLSLWGGLDGARAWAERNGRAKVKSEE